MERAQQGKEENEKVMPDEAISQLRKSLEQAAVGRADQTLKVQEKSGPKASPEASIGASMGENWMKDLKPEEIKVLGEIIREYLGENRGTKCCCLHVRSNKIIPQ